MKIDYTGHKFNRLTVLEYVSKGKYNNGKTRWLWKCQCECGNICYLRTYEITKGNRKSCGCYMKDFNKKNNTLPNFLSEKRTLFRCYKASARKRKIEFKLTFGDFCNLLDQKCHYCNREPKESEAKRFKKGFKYNGIDRVNNNIGYLLDNCVSCCGKCNSSKNNSNLKDWEKWIYDLYKAQKRKGTFNDYPDGEYIQVDGNREDPE